MRAFIPRFWGSPALSKKYTNSCTHWCWKQLCCWWLHLVYRWNIDWQQCIALRPPLQLIRWLKRLSPRGILRWTPSSRIVLRSFVFIKLLYTIGIMINIRVYFNPNLLILNSFTSIVNTIYTIYNRTLIGVLFSPPAAERAFHIAICLSQGRCLSAFPSTRSFCPGLSWSSCSALHSFQIGALQELQGVLHFL